MHYLKISISPGDIPGHYIAEPCEDPCEDDPDTFIEEIANVGLTIFELGVDNLAAELDIRGAIDIQQERIQIPDDPDGRSFYFGLAAQQ